MIGQADRHRQTDGHPHKLTDNQIDRQKYKLRDRETDRQIDTHTHKHKHKQIDTHKHKQTINIGLPWPSDYSFEEFSTSEDFHHDIEVLFRFVQAVHSYDVGMIHQL